MAATQIIEADNKKFVGIQRSTGTNDVVPPTDVIGLVGIMAGDVVVAGECVTNEYGVRFGGVQGAVGFINQIVGGQNPPLRKCNA